MTHIQNPDVLHEVSDVNTKPIYKFGFWMIVIVVGTAVLMWLFYDMLASREAKKSGAFVLPGFGKLVLANRKARIGRNPQTGEPIKIPAKRVCKFRLAKSLKDTVLGKK